MFFLLTSIEGIRSQNTLQTVKEETEGRCFWHSKEQILITNKDHFLDQEIKNDKD